MKRPVLTRVVVLAAMPLSGCAPGTLAWLVPKLELRWRMQRADVERTLRSREHVEMRVAASLRFQAPPAAQRVPSRLERTPAAWIAPCELDDAPCLQEVAEAEQELRALLSEDR